MRGQSFDVDAFVTNELQKAFDVSLFGPANVRQRIIVSTLFVIRIIPTWSIRHGDDQFRYVADGRLAHDVVSRHAPDDQAADETGHTSCQVDGLVRLCGGFYQHCTRAESTR